MFYIALIGWIALHFKRVLFSIISLIVLLLFSIPLLTRSLSFNHVSLQYNNKNSDSFAQLSLMKNNSIESYVVDKKNYIFINDNSNQIKDINSSPIYSYFIPGEIFTTFDSSLMKNLFHISDYQDYQIDKKYSLLKNDYLNYNFSNYYNEYTNALILRPEDVNPLFLSNIDYENLLLDNISTIVESNDTNYIQLKDELLVQQLLSDLANDKNINWIKLNEKEIMTLRSLLGINTTYNQLFYYQDNYQWFSQKTPNLLERIEIKYNKSLSELLNYLWNSENTQNNINNTFGNIDPIFENVNDLYPSVKVLDNNKMPTKFDIDFIKNDLIRFQNNSIAYLTTNGTYENTNSLTDIDPSIVDKQSWDAYIDNNVFNVDGAQRIVKSLSNKLPNLAQMTFSFNNLNLNQFSYYFTLSDNTYLDHSEIYVTALIFIILFVAWASLNKFKKLNYKNIEYN
ncbi:MAG: hypothetical protein HDR43_01175 [Mycoplasma sp.]|nr:hypothetical protein [Mycoplasma sp.]